MKKLCKKLLSLLLACTLVFACGVTAFASDEGLVERKQTPAPKTWVTTMDYTSTKDKNTGCYICYYNINKVTLPCNGTVSISMVSADGCAYEDEQTYTDPAGQVTVEKTGLFLYKTVPSYYGNVKYYKVFGFGGKTKATHTVTLKKGTYYFASACNIKFKYTFTPVATTVSGVKNSSSKAATVKWKKASGATGYQVQYSLKKSFASVKTVTVKKASAYYTKIKKMKKGKNYYVRVRYYTKVNGKYCYSKWSSVKAVKIRK